MSTMKKQPGKFGRALVPFFLSDQTEDLVENVEHQVPDYIKRQQTELLIPQDARLEVRKFTDGYFEIIDMPMENIELDSNLHKVVSKGKETPVAKKLQNKRDNVVSPRKESLHIQTIQDSYRFEDLLYIPEKKRLTSPKKTQNKEFISQAPTEEEILKQITTSRNEFAQKSITESELLKQVAPVTKKTNFAGSSWEYSPAPSSLPLPKFK